VLPAVPGAIAYRAGSLAVGGVWMNKAPEMDVGDIVPSVVDQFARRDYIRTS
jgi:hypothetical protein